METACGLPKSRAYQSVEELEPSVVHRLVISEKNHFLPSIAWNKDVSGEEFIEAEGTG